MGEETEGVMVLVTEEVTEEGIEGATVTTVTNTEVEVSK